MRTNHPRATAIALALLLCGASAAHAQTAPDPSGHWKGSVEIPGQTMPFEIDLAKDAKGQFVGTISGTDVKNLPLTKVAVSGRSVTLQASTEQPYKGELSTDGRTITGTVILSGYSLPLELTRTGDARIEPPPTSAPIGNELEGIWEGTLNAGRGPLRIVLTMSESARGPRDGADRQRGRRRVDDSHRHHAEWVERVVHVATAVPSAWAGVLSADGHELAGTFSRGPASLPLNFRRVAGAGK